jgi:hypothetical protein
MAGHHAGDLPGRPAGPVSTCSVPGAPRHRPAPRPQRPCRPAGAKAAPPPGRRPNGGPGLRSTSCQPATATAAPSPSRPARCRQATTPPTDRGGTSTPAPGRGGPSPSHPGSSAARTARRQRRGHQSLSGRTPGGPGHLDTGHRTPDTWMLEVRSTGWTDIPRRTGRGGQGNARPGRRPDILGPATPAGRPVKPSTSSHAGPVTPSRPAPQRPPRRRSRRPGRTACRPLLRSRCRPPRSGPTTGRRPWPDQATRSQAATRPGCRRRQRPTAQVHATAPLSSLAPAGAWGSRTPYRRAWPSAAAAHPALIACSRR